MISILALLLTGCSVTPEPLTLAERNRQVVFDMAQRFAGNHRPDQPITIEQALARAIRFNLPHRLRTMETALSRDMATIANQQMLPRLAADAGYSTQNRLSSENGQLTTSTADLNLSWNVLDFGVSYFSALQQADRALIATQLERKAAHILTREVHNAFWRVIAADRLEKMIRPLKIRLQNGLENARKAEKEKIEPPIPVLDFQVTLLENMQRLQRLERELSGARIKLAELMDVDPGFRYVLVEPARTDPLRPDQLPKVETLEYYALLHRPELWERSYQRRIKAYETKKALLRLFPGLDFSQSGNYDSTKTHINNLWTAFGLNLTWDLMGLLHAPDTIALARSEERLEDFRRLALNMGIMAQLHVALRRLHEARAAHRIVAHLSAAKERLFHHAQAAKKAETLDELQLISREGERIEFLTRHHIAYAELQNAAHALLVTLGVDPLPEGFQYLSVETLAKAIGKRSRTLPDSLTDQTEPRPEKPVDEADDQRPVEPEKRDEDLDQPQWEIEPAEPQPTTDSGSDQPQREPEPAVDADLDQPDWEIEDHGEEQPATVPKIDSGAKPGQFLIRAGFFSRPEYAERMQQRLEKASVSSFRKKSAGDGGGEQVFIGPLDDLAKARELTRRLRRTIRSQLLLFRKRADGRLRQLYVDPPPGENGEGGRSPAFFRLNIGPFITVKEAQRWEERLKGEGLPAYYSSDRDERGRMAHTIWIELPANGEEAGEVMRSFLLKRDLGRFLGSSHIYSL